MGSNCSAVSEAKAANAAVSLVRKNALILGGTSGIGLATAHALAALGCSVTIVGRNEEVGKREVEEMKKLASPKVGATGDVTFIFEKTDLLSLKNCKNLIDKILSTAPRLDYVIFCNSKGTLQDRTPTKDENLDEKLELNFYSRVFMTDLLIPLLRRTAATDGNNNNKNDVRVMSIFSGGVHSAYADYKTDPRLEKNYTLMNAANMAGFFTDLCFDKFSRLYPEITFVHSAPGFVETNFSREFGVVMRGLTAAMMAIAAKSSTDCAELMLRGLLDPKLRGGFRVMNQYGKEIDGPRRGKTDLHSDEAMDFVWKDTQDVLSRFNFF